MSDTIWVCAACGKTATERKKFKDVACYMNAVECYPERNENGTFKAVSQNDGNESDE